MAPHRLSTWEYKGARVVYRAELDGGGTALASSFARFVASRASRRYEAAFEWCAGPAFFSLNPGHSRYETFKDDLRPNDPGWELHRRFYQGIRRHLRPGAIPHISEVAPESELVFIPPSESEPYDVRPRPASVDFSEMIAAVGLELLDTTHYFTGKDGAKLSMMTSRNPE